MKEFCLLTPFTGDDAPIERLAPTCGEGLIRNYLQFSQKMWFSLHRPFQKVT